MKDNVVKHDYCTVVVYEGTQWPDGRFIAEAGTRDAIGHAQLGGAAPVVGIGAVGTCFLGIFLFRELATLVRFFFVGLIVVGIVGLKLAS